MVSIFLPEIFLPLSFDPSDSTLVTAAHQVEMQVRNFLAAGFATVDDHVVSVMQTFFGGDFRECQDAVADDRFVFFFQVRQRNDFLFGDHQDMDRRFRLDVTKGHADVVFVNDVGGDFAFDDFAKDRCHGLSLCCFNRNQESNQALTANASAWSGCLNLLILPAGSSYNSIVAVDSSLATGESTNNDESDAFSWPSTRSSTSC